MRGVLPAAAGGTDDFNGVVAPAVCLATFYELFGVDIGPQMFAPVTLVGSIKKFACADFDIVHNRLIQSFDHPHGSISRSYGYQAEYFDFFTLRS